MPRFEVEVVKRVFVTCEDPSGAERIASYFNERPNAEGYSKAFKAFRYQDFPPVSARVIREVTLENMATYRDPDEGEA